MSLTDDVGVYSSTAEYVRFVGIVSRGWNEGFGNGWVGGTDAGASSNGHLEIDDCISYSNGRTGFTFFSASGFHGQALDLRAQRQQHGRARGRAA